MDTFKDLLDEYSGKQPGFLATDWGEEASAALRGLMAEAEKLEAFMQKLLARSGQNMVDGILQKMVDRSITHLVNNEIKRLKSFGQLSQLEEAENAEVMDDKKAEFYLRLGKTCNACPNPPPETEAYLMKAAKLSRTSVDAWNELGEYYWNKGDIQSAKTTTKAALEKQENIESLRNLATIYRHLKPSSPEEYEENLNLSLKYGLRAVFLDNKDGKSLTTLGNTYLSSYARTHKIANLSSCVNCYKKALMSDPRCAKDPDFALNYGNILRIAEMYQEAVEWYQKAESLSPNWAMAEGKADALFRSLKVVEENVTSNGRLKQKKIEQFLNTPETPEEKQRTLLLTVDDEYKICKNIESLKPDVMKRKKALSGFVVADVPMESGVPRCLVVMVNHELTVVINVYNVAKELPIKIGDRLSVINLDFKEVVVIRGEQSAKFPLLRVDNPGTIFINGKVMPLQFIVSCQVISSRADGPSNCR